MTSKPFWQSKTIVINTILSLASIAALFVPGASGIGVWISGHAAEIGMIWGVLNIVLRAVTKDAISLGD